MDDTDEFVAAKNKFQRRKLDAAPFAIKREPRAVHRIQVEKLRRPIGDFRGHARQFFFLDHKRNAREIHEERVADDALFARHPGRGAGEAIARRRGERGPARARMFVQNLRNEGVEPQGALFLFIPPAAPKNDGQTFLGGAGGVFELDRLIFEQALERMNVRQEIAGKVRAHFALLQKGQLPKTRVEIIFCNLAQRLAIDR